MNIPDILRIKHRLESLHGVGHGWRFDMRAWFRVDGRAFISLCEIDQHQPFTACLAGWTQATLAQPSCTKLPACLFAKVVLNIPDCALDHWFSGGWSEKRAEAGIDEAVAFLANVVRTGNPLASADVEF